mmetsp:Transcript_24574/g.54735  ORF Transcript_24574/g.54735 Transcript_24574/m.54735 type:complete len:232 (-) Transcript_24574:752-1447(-)
MPQTAGCHSLDVCRGPPRNHCRRSPPNQQSGASRQNAAVKRIEDRIRAPDNRQAEGLNKLHHQGPLGRHLVVGVASWKREDGIRTLVCDEYSAISIPGKAPWEVEFVGQGRQVVAALGHSEHIVRRIREDDAVECLDYAVGRVRVAHHCVGLDSRGSLGQRQTFCHGTLGMAIGAVGPEEPVPVHCDARRHSHVRVSAIRVQRRDDRELNLARCRFVQGLIHSCIGFEFLL